MRIVRGPATKADFTILPNQTLRDAALSYRARGVLAYLLSHADGWQTSSEDLAARGREGRDAIRTALTELELAGYLERRREQDRVSGLWSTTVIVHETPTPGFQSSVDQSSDNQRSVSQASTRRTIQKIPQPPTTSGAICSRHPNNDGAGCRACGTSPRQIAAQASRERAQARRVTEQETARQATAEARQRAVDSRDVADLVDATRRKIRSTQR